VRFFTASGLATACAEAREERQVQRLQGHVQRRHVIIVDELGHVPPGQGAPENLFNFFSLCCERVSLIVTTNLPVSEWPHISPDRKFRAGRGRSALVTRGRGWLLWLMQATRRRERH
jgi:DNA replication protein DnaC